MPKTIHTESYRTLVKLIRRRREELGLSQSQVAAKVRRGRTWVQKIETCERRLDLIETVDLLKALEIELDVAVRLVRENAR